MPFGFTWQRKNGTTFDLNSYFFDASYKAVSVMAPLAEAGTVVVGFGEMALAETAVPAAMAAERAVTVTEEGLSTVTQHLAQFEACRT